MNKKLTEEVTTKTIVYKLFAFCIIYLFSLKFYFEITDNVWLVVNMARTKIQETYTALPSMIDAHHLVNYTGILLCHITPHPILDSLQASLPLIAPT